MLGRFLSSALDLLDLGLELLNLGLEESVLVGQGGDFLLFGEVLVLQRFDLGLKLLGLLGCGVRLDAEGVHLLRRELAMP